MTAPIMQIVWLHRRIFAWTMCLTLLVLAIVIFGLTKPRATIQSSIEIGSFMNNDEKEEPVIAPDLVVKMITDVYVPSALLAMERKGASPVLLSSLRTTNVEDIGRIVVLVNTIEPNGETQAKEFQQIIADQIIRMQAPRSQALRERIAEQLALTTRSSLQLEQEISSELKEITRLNALSESLESQIENQRNNLAALYQRSATVQADERSTLEAQIRESQEQISSQAKIMGSLTLERSDTVRDLGRSRRRQDAQAKAKADIQLQQSLVHDSSLSLPPTLMPSAVSASRWLSLTFVALIISVLVAFGTVVLVHNALDIKPRH